MSKIRQKPLTPQLAAEWASLAHAAYLDALMSESELDCDQIAFHGGTSLHLSWRSPRHSEDIDFLLSRKTKSLDTISAKVAISVQEYFSAIDPLFTIELKNKTRDESRMPVYHLVVSHPHFMGNTMVKVEFWRVDPDYLKKYPTEFKTPATQADMVSRLSNPVPAAKLETAYCDKLTAFATRPHLKWRDIYDLWWIGTQTDSTLDLESIATQFLHNVSAYTTLDSLPPADALRLFLKNDKEWLVKKADPDLKKWLPENVWQRLHPEGVSQMVDYVFHALATVADQVDKHNDESIFKPRSLKMVPPCPN